MESLQRRRYEKIFYEKFYLLEKKTIDKNIQFFISGSTANVYTITIDLEDKYIFCNCPDMKNEKMYERGYICKHCCFILLRVLKCIDICNTLLFTYFELSEDEIKNIEKKIRNFNISTSDDFVNIDLLDKYRNLSLKDENSKNSRNSGNNTEIDNYIPNDTCIICFEEFNILKKGDKKNDNITNCPKCRNITHKKCIEKWINMGKNTCVYCRANVWKNSCNNNYKNLNNLI